MRIRFTIKHLFLLTFVVGVGLTCWMAGNRVGHESGRNEVNAALKRAGTHAIFRIDDDGNEAVFENGKWVAAPPRPIPPPPPPPLSERFTTFSKTEHGVT